MELIEYPDREMMMMRVADTLASGLRGFLRREERATFCVPGGTTPGPVFDVLSGLKLDWSRVDVVLNDERWVDERSERSNTRLLRARLLRDYAGAANLLPLWAEGDAPEDRLEELSAAIEPHLPISVLLLGMGDDMHTASLFPGADRLSDALADDAPVLMAMRAPGAQEPRITLTARVLKAALSTHLLIVGDAKREALERARKLPVEDAPIRALLAEATVHWAA
ncbi:6-phosphogluconolactonase [Brevirhabdus sp.]|uniref:6-phosphogluconolactonase n=1 Tax=Brevirhabdus sp. TaxID=2004514 RepID=UPI004059CD3E